MRLLTRPRAPHPRPEPFIRPRDPNKGRAGGPRLEDLAPSPRHYPPRQHSPSPAPGGASGKRRGPAIVPDSGRNRKSWGLPAGSVREAAACGSGSLGPQPRGQGSRAGLGRSGPPPPWVGGWMQGHWGAWAGRTAWAGTCGSVTWLPPDPSLLNLCHCASRPNPSSPVFPAPPTPPRVGPFPEVRPPKP